MRQWQVDAAYYWDRHSKRIYVTNGQPYPVIRAIPVDGKVGPSWAESPQAKFWLDEPGKTVWERFIAWLNK